MQTSRLELRPIAEADLDALVELDGFPKVREAVDPFREHIPDDVAARRAYEARLVGRMGFLAAVERESGLLVGWFQFERSAVGSGEIELGYRLRPDVWGLGLASEGARALVAEAMGRPDVSRVYAHALLSNRGSIRVMEKAGLSYASPWAYRGLPGAEYEARAPAVGAEYEARAPAVGAESVARAPAMGAEPEARAPVVGATPGPLSAPAKRP